MPALHIKAFEYHRDGAVYYFALQAARNDGNVGLRVRITYKPRRGAERLIGFATINRDGELVKRPEEIDEEMCLAIEKEIINALD